jgi:hypothetical protein
MASPLSSYAICRYNDENPLKNEYYTVLHHLDQSKLGITAIKEAKLLDKPRTMVIILLIEYCYIWQ